MNYLDGADSRSSPAERAATAALRAIKTRMTIEPDPQRARAITGFEDEDVQEEIYVRAERSNLSMLAAKARRPSEKVENDPKMS